MSHISISVVVVESFRPFSAEKKERRETSMYIASYIESKKKKSICIHDARPKSTKSPIYQKLFFDHNTPEDDDERREKYYWRTVRPVCKRERERREKKLFSVSSRSQY